jgi:hypothetical protein
MIVRLPTRSLKITLRGTLLAAVCLTIAATAAAERLPALVAAPAELTPGLKHLLELVGSRAKPEGDPDRIGSLMAFITADKPRGLFFSPAENRPALGVLPGSDSPKPAPGQNGHLSPVAGPAPCRCSDIRIRVAGRRVQRPVIFISGASRGIGIEVLRWLALAGVRVSILARSFRAPTKAADVLFRKLRRILSLMRLPAFEGPHQ